MLEAESIFVVIQMVTINSPSAYREYEPYHFAVFVV